MTRGTTLNVAEKFFTNFPLREEARQKKFKYVAEASVFRQSIRGTPRRVDAYIDTVQRVTPTGQDDVRARRTRSLHPYRREKERDKVGQETMVNRATDGAQGLTNLTNLAGLAGAAASAGLATTSEQGRRRSSRGLRANQPADLCCDKTSLRRVACVFLCRSCQSVLGDSSSLVAAYSLHGPSNVYSSVSRANKKTMVSLRATTRNVVHAEDGELSCACGAALGRAVDRGAYEEGDARALNGSFQLDTSSLIRYRLGVDAGVRLCVDDGYLTDEGMGVEGELDGERERAGRTGPRRLLEHGRERRQRREGGSWDEAVRDTLMDLKRRVRALESNFNHHDRELTDHFNTIRTLEAALAGRDERPVF